MFNRATIDILKSGGVAVIPTDTIYGIVGSALNPETVERIYRIRKRDASKKCIILIEGIADLRKFGIQLDPILLAQAEDVWQKGSVSIDLPCPTEYMNYLHKNTFSLAFRIVQNESLRTLLESTGPLIAPSANPEGSPPATTVREAQEYFGSAVDIYCDGGTLVGKPSTLVQLIDTGMTILRQGSVML